MSQQNEGGIKAFTAGADLEAFRRVKLSSGSGTQVEYAGAGENHIGVTQEKKLSGEFISVGLKHPGRTFKATASEALSAGASIYGALNGKVKDTAEGSILGKALEEATADGDVIECLFDEQPGGIDGASTDIEAEGANGHLPVLFKKEGITDANAASVTIVTAPYKFRIIDWWLISRDTTAGNIKLVNVSTDATAVKAKGTTNDAIVRGGDVIAAQKDVASGAALKVNASAVAAFDIFVLVIRVA